MRDINSTSRGECLGHKQAQLFTMHSQDFQTKVVQQKGWLSAIVYCCIGKTNDLEVGSMDQRKVHGSRLYRTKGERIRGN